MNKVLFNMPQMLCVNTLKVYVSQKTNTSLNSYEFATYNHLHNAFYHNLSKHLNTNRSFLLE